MTTNIPHSRKLAKLLYDLGAHVFPLHGKYNEPLPDDPAEYDRWKSPTKKAIRGDRSLQVTEIRDNQWFALVPASLDLVIYDFDKTYGEDGCKAHISIERLKANDIPFEVIQTRKGVHLAIKVRPTTYPLGNATFNIEGESGELRYNNGYVVCWDPEKLYEATELDPVDGELLLSVLPTTKAPKRATAPMFTEAAPMFTEEAPHKTDDQPWVLPSNWQSLTAAELFPPGDRDLRLLKALTTVFLSEPHNEQALFNKWKDAPNQKADHIDRYHDKATRMREAHEGKGYKEKTREALLTAFRQNEISVRLNMRSGRFDFKINGKLSPPETTEEQEVAHIIEILKATCFEPTKRGLKPWTWSPKLLLQVLNSITFDAGRYDPFKTWVETIPESDDITFATKFLRDHFDAEDSPISDWASQYLGVAALQRAYEPGCELHTIPVLIGAQGIGKSSLAKALLPPARKHDWHGASFDITAETKVKIEQTVGNVFVEWPELAGVHRDLQTAKAYLSNPHDQARLAYGHSYSKVLRRFIFIGTADRIEVLPNDPEGNRRFTAVKLNKPWLAHIRMTDEIRAKYWGACRKMYNEGLRANFPEELRDMQNQVNENYRAVDESVEDAIATLDPSQRYSFTAIREKCPRRVSNNAIKAGLTAAGWGQKRVNTAEGKKRLWFFEGIQPNLDLL